MVGTTLTGFALVFVRIQKQPFLSRLVDIEPQAFPLLHCKLEGVGAGERLRALLLETLQAERQIAKKMIFFMNFLLKVNNY